MTCCQILAAEPLRITAEHAKLDLTIAQHIRIRRTACPVFVEEILENPIAVFPRKIDVMQWYVQLLADLARVLQVLGGRAVAIVVLPVGHVQCKDIRSVLLEEYRGHGRIHPA